MTVGSMTIPMMKKLGYRPHFAAGVEATASTGGQITPPVMGAAAFLMVEFLSLPTQTLRHMGSAASRHVRQHFAFDRQLEQTLALYRKLATLSPA